RYEKCEVVLAARQVVFRCGDAKEAELLACQEGLSLAIQWRHSPLILESDCQNVCNALNLTLEDRSRLAFLIQEVKFLTEEHMF
uniref:RNase H type-1 domain-containing protein n=1 Tax=Setaria italica TaxID=4555 RepID=K4AKJ7_SETIT